MLAALCDDITFGIAIVNRDAELLYVNLAARQCLGEADALLESGQRLRAAAPDDETALAHCVEAGFRGERNWHVFHGSRRSFNVAFVPLSDSLHEAVEGVALVFERPALCNGVSRHFFARANGLTTTEARLTGALCRSNDVAEAAENLHISVSTARTHVKNILHKTGAHNLRALLLRLGMLPPVSSRLELASRNLPPPGF